MLSEIISAIELLDSEYNKTLINIDIAKNFNKLNQTDKAIEFFNQAIVNMNIVAKEENYDVCDLKSKIATELSFANQQQALTLLEEALQEANQLEDCEVRDPALMLVGEVFAQMKRYNKAIDIGLMIEDIYDRDYDYFVSLARFAINNNDEPIDRIRDSFGHSRERDNFLSELIAIYCANNQLVKAENLISQIKTPSSKVLGITNYVKNAYKSTEQSEVIKLLEQAEECNQAEKDLTTKSQSLRWIAECYIDLQLLGKAKSLLNSAKNLLAVNSNHDDILVSTSNDFMLTSLASSFAKLNDSQNTIETNDLITDKKCFNSVLVNAIEEQNKQKDSEVENQVDEQLKQKAIEELLKLEESLKKDKEDDPHLSQLQMTSIVESWVKLGMLDKAKSLAEEMTDSGFKKLALHYCGIKEESQLEKLNRQCDLSKKENDSNEALKILNQALKQLPTVEQNLRYSLLAKIVSSYFHQYTTQ